MQTFPNILSSEPLSPNVFTLKSGQPAIFEGLIVFMGGTVTRVHALFSKK